MSVLMNHCLVLSKNWMPFETCTVKRAFVKVLSDGAMFVNTEDCSTHDFMSWADLPVQDGMLSLRTSQMCIRVPEVIVLTASVMGQREIRFTRRSLLKRDKHTCQYCGKSPSPAQLTIDHVIPKSKGGKHTWLNCVISCFDCNIKKGNKYLEQTNMRLMSQPHEPAWSPIFRCPKAHYRESWKQFLPEKMFA